MFFDFGMLRNRIIDKYGSQILFSKALGISTNAFTKKINNKVKFSMDDILRISELLDIKKEEIGDYFFVKKFNKFNLK